MGSLLKRESMRLTLLKVGIQIKTARSIVAYFDSTLSRCAALSHLASLSAFTVFFFFPADIFLASRVS